MEKYLINPYQKIAKINKDRSEEIAIIENLGSAIGNHFNIFTSNRCIFQLTVTAEVDRCVILEFDITGHYRCHVVRQTAFVICNSICLLNRCTSKKNKQQR